MSVRRCWRPVLAAALAALVASHTAAQQVSLVFAGDTTLDDDAGALIARGGDPLAPFAALFAGADLRIANLECVVATTGKAGSKNYTFRAHPRVLPVLRRHLDGVTLANNHSGDYGREAFAEMLGLLKQAGLAQAGGGMNLAQAHTPWMVERHGLRIAILSYNEFMPRSFEADFDAPGIAWSEDEQVVDDIRRARSVHRADVVIPIMHWGWEEPVANARQRALAKLMIDAGADAVVGGHPHQLQDTEAYKGKPIFYSLGNFVFEGFSDPIHNVAWAVRLELDRQGVRSWQAHEIQIDRAGLPHAGKQPVQRVTLR